MQSHFESLPPPLTAEQAEATVLEPSPTGKIRVLWLHNNINHYFVDMLDTLNAQGGGCAEIVEQERVESRALGAARRETGGVEYFGIFLCPPPEESPLTKLPQQSPCLFMGTGDLIQSGPWKDRPLRPDAEEIIENAKFDMAIVGGYDFPFKRWFIRYCHSAKIPVAMFADSNIHGEFDGTARSFCKRLAKRIMLRPVIQQLNYILAANSAGVEYWKYYGCPASKLRVCTYYSDVPAAVVPDPQARTRLLAQCGIPQQIVAGKNLIFTAARLAPEKGLHLMVEAFTKLNLADKKWLWVVAGTGPLKERLQRQAGKLNGKAIFFAGVQPHDVVKSLAGQADLFVLPSNYEPHGIVVPEAMGAGTPVIASDACGSALDYVEPAKTGWLFKNTSSHSLADVLVQATASTDALGQMRPACREKYQRQYGVTSPVVVVPELVGRVFGPAPVIEVGVGNLTKTVTEYTGSKDGARRDVVAVLGPPRSGSSAIMRGLTCLGVHLGDDIDLRAAGPGNPEGFWEDRRVMRLCEDAMSGFGMQWDSLRVLDPADLASPLGTRYVGEAAAIIRHGADGSPTGVWGCKNPRMARLSRLWMAAAQEAGCRDCYVVSLRNPLSVVSSVILGSPHRGAGLSPTHLHLMWLVHMIGALRPAMGGKPTVIVDFDNLLARPRDELIRVATRLDLPVTGQMQVAIDAYGAEFLKQGLRHSAFSPQDLDANPQVPRIVAKAYEILREAAGDGVAVGSPEFIGRWREIESQAQELNAVFRYIDALDHRIMKRQALARRIYRRLPIKFKKLLARIA